VNKVKELTQKLIGYEGRGITDHIRYIQAGQRAPRRLAESGAKKQQVIRSGGSPYFLGGGRNPRQLNPWEIDYSFAAEKVKRGQARNGRCHLQKKSKGGGGLFGSDG
jgi:hypothetical protein